MRYWWQSTFALLATFVLVACSDTTSQVGLKQVEAVFTAPIPSLSPETSATPLPTETATFMPTPQPSPTPTPSPEPSQTPAPTPEGLETYGLQFSTATDEEIDLALEALEYKTTFPLRRPPGYDGYEISGVLANSEIVDIEFEGGYHIIYRGMFYYLRDGMRQEVSVNLLTTFEEGDFIKAAMVALPRQLDNPSLIKMTYPGLIRKATISTRLILNVPDGKAETLPGLGPEVIGPKTFLTPIFEQLGFDREDLSSFVQTGDSSHLPKVDGRSFLPFLYLYTEN